MFHTTRPGALFPRQPLSSLIGLSVLPPPTLSLRRRLCTAVSGGDAAAVAIQSHLQNVFVLADSQQMSRAFDVGRACLILKS